MLLAVGVLYLDIDRFVKTTTMSLLHLCANCAVIRRTHQWLCWPNGRLTFCKHACVDTNIW